MARDFLTESRHGTIYYYRRRVPDDLRAAIGKPYLIKSLGTGLRRAAIIMARAYAVKTDEIFFQLRAMRIKKNENIRTDYTLTIDLNDFGKPSSITVDAKPDEQEAVNSGIRAAIEASMGRDCFVTPAASASAKEFVTAVSEYFQQASIKAQSKATYRSKLEHAQQFFGGESTDVLSIDQAGLVRYADHVRSSVSNITSQGHYITTVAGFLNWHRCRVSGHSLLTIRTLIPRKDTPDSEERDAFSLSQLGQVFDNARKYRIRNHCKFWVSVAPAFLGCRIEELCQIHIKTDLVRDDEADIWYFNFDGRPDPDGSMRKSMK